MVATSIIADLCIYILTWNVGTKPPTDISLVPALSLNGTSICPHDQLPDIYVIAFQEINTKPKSQISAIFQDDPWIFKVRDHLNGFEYEKVATEQLQGLLIMLFAQRQHISHIRDIETENTRTGFGGLWGNKGAVSIRMSLYGTGVTFVDAHLAAHDDKLDDRIEDFKQILDNHHYKTPKYRMIFDHDLVLWFGDLNFRLNGGDNPQDVVDLIEDGKLEELLDRDQLNYVRKNGIAFSLLNEEPPRFPPTFKFHEGTSTYNLKRVPAWCDRILYRIQKDKYPDIELSIKQLSYKSHPDYEISDHKPVSAVFLYTIQSQSRTDDEIYELTHSSTETPLASVIIIMLSTFLTIF